MIINNMTITAYSVLLIITLAIFLFCYFVATRVWIKVDEQNRKIFLRFFMEKYFNGKLASTIAER